MTFSVYGTLGPWLVLYKPVFTASFSNRGSRPERPAFRQLPRESSVVLAFRRLWIRSWAAVRGEQSDARKVSVADSWHTSGDESYACLSTTLTQTSFLSMAAAMRLKEMRRCTVRGYKRKIFGETSPLRAFRVSIINAASWTNAL